MAYLMTPLTPRVRVGQNAANQLDLEVWSGPWTATHAELESQLTLPADAIPSLARYLARATQTVPFQLGDRVRVKTDYEYTEFRGHEAFVAGMTIDHDLKVEVILSAQWPPPIGFRPSEDPWAATDLELVHAAARGY